MAISAIILAAGSGARMGADKLLLPVGGRAMLAQSIAPYLACQAIDEVIVVVRPGFAGVEGMGRAWVVENPAHAEGMGASLRVGVAAATGDEAMVLGLGDLPWLRGETVAGAVAAWHRVGGVVVAFHAGRRGHPVVVPGALRERLLGARGDVGARQVLERWEGRVTLWPTDDAGAVRDVDVPADLDGGSP